MHTLHDHHVEGAATTVEIHVADQPGSGGAYHRYEVHGFNARHNASLSRGDHPAMDEKLVILFQNGPVPTNGVNGITQEVLLAISADRLRCFQAGPFASADNAEALEHIEQALECLHRRTRNRLSRDVEGKEVA